jgi:uncharacterized repeat protein (TIGR01451 family)
MKKIIKNSILVFVLLVGVLGLNVNLSFAAPADVMTIPASVTENSITFNGAFNSNGTTPTEVRFEYGTTESLGSNTIGVLKSNLSGGFSETISGLTPGTRYYYRAVAVNADPSAFVAYGDTLWGETINTAVAPSVMTIPASATSNSITFNGSFNSNGTTPTEVRFEYGTDQNNLDSSTNPPVNTSNLSGGFSKTLSVPEITAGTTYYYRAIATNFGGSAQGTILSIHTTSGGNGNSCPNGPTITSLSPDEVNEGAAATVVTINGTNFISGTTEVLVNGTNWAINSITSTALTITLSSAELISNGNISITVQNGSCSDVATFTINNVGGGNGGGGSGGGSSNTYPTVVTVSSTNITGTSATLNGTVDPNDHTTNAWFEYGTSSTLSTNHETIHTTAGSGNSAVDFNQGITGLAQNTTYYFRIVAENNHGTKRGEIKSFSTSENTNGIITTIQATNQLANSAKLNGLFVNNSGGSVQGWFEYGKTSNLSSNTSAVSLGSGASLSFSKTVTTLTSDTIYYFRAVAKRNGTTYKGDILVFKTKKLIPQEETTNNTPEQVVETTETDIASSIFSITTGTETTEVGQEIEYTINYKNDSDKNLENAVVTVQLPDAVEFLASDVGILGENNTVVLNLGTLAPSQEGTMKIVGKVTEKATDLGVLVTTGIMSYTPAGSTFQRDEIAYVTNKINPTSDLGAASIWGNGSFLPSTILGWLAVILVVLGFIIVGKNLYAAYAYRRSQRQYGDLPEEENLDNIDLDSLPKA